MGYLTVLWEYNLMYYVNVLMWEYKLMVLLEHYGSMNKYYINQFYQTINKWDILVS